MESGLCLYCGVKPRCRCRSGKGWTYRSLCRTCKNRKRDKRERIKDLHCSRCSFVAVDPCQIDIHHKDRNHNNDDPANIENLCACCHRLEHKDDAHKDEHNNASRPTITISEFQATQKAQREARYKAARQIYASDTTIGCVAMSVALGIPRTTASYYLKKIGAEGKPSAPISA